MKEIVFAGRSRDFIREFPLSVKREAGYQLDRVQRGFDPDNWKPMPSIGQGVKEIRIQDKGQYRVIYIANFEDAIYVLHAFRKKGQKTSRRDSDTAKKALRAIASNRK